MQLSLTKTAFLNSSRDMSDCIGPRIPSYRFDFVLLYVKVSLLIRELRLTMAFCHKERIKHKRRSHEISDNELGRTSLLKF